MKRANRDLPEPVSPRRRTESSLRAARAMKLRTRAGTCTRAGPERPSELRGLIAHLPSGAGGRAAHVRQGLNGRLLLIPRQARGSRWLSRCGILRTHRRMTNNADSEEINGTSRRKEVAASPSPCGRRLRKGRQDQARRPRMSASVVNPGGRIHAPMGCTLLTVRTLVGLPTELLNPKVALKPLRRRAALS